MNKGCLSNGASLLFSHAAGNFTAKGNQPVTFSATFAAKPQFVMNKIGFKRLLAAIACILIIINAYRLDYSNLSWSNNQLKYINIAAMVFILAAMVLSMRKKDDNTPQ